MNLSRSRNGMIGGVAAGLSDAFGIDVTLVRLAFVLISLFLGGGLLLYIALWVILPREDDGRIIAQEQFTKAAAWYKQRKGGDTDYTI